VETRRNGTTVTMNNLIGGSARLGICKAFRATVSRYRACAAVERSAQEPRVERQRVTPVAESGTAKESRSVEASIAAGIYRERRFLCGNDGRETIAEASSRSLMSVLRHPILRSLPRISIEFGSLSQNRAEVA